MDEFPLLDQDLNSKVLRVCNAYTIAVSVTVILQHTAQPLLLLSCDGILKFDWSCQLQAMKVTVQTLQAVSTTAWE